MRVDNRHGFAGARSTGWALGGAAPRVRSSREPRLLSSFASALGILALVGACARRPVPDPVVRPPIAFLPSRACATPTGDALPPVRVTDTLSATYARQNPNAAQAYAARHFPGGYLNGPAPVAPLGRWTIAMRNPVEKQALLRLMDSLSVTTRVPGVAIDSIDVRQSEWDAAALYDWLYFLMDRPDRPAGVNSWGMTRGGRIEIGLESAASVPALLTALDRLGVPCSLVVFGVWGPIVAT